ncbi:MAG: polysaccharide deacetylase family protein [Candidatus Rokubacteria bacterium]|nr:polysaccharide deacetylase family protein [Candidatus Rokubacteria bacterium]
MTTRKPIASLSLDLDNKWSYMKTRGEPGWERFPSYLDLVVPRVLDFLGARNLAITVFIVGQDAAVAENRPLLSAIAAAGHEIGNHSFHHEPWLHLYSEQQIGVELERAEEHIERATGRIPCGFRGPGFSLSRTVVQVLVRRGYLYDASTLPTFLGPLARAYYLRTSGMSREEIRQRRALFGSFRDGLRPIRPYRLRTDAGEIIEIPVTTMPVFRVPIHVSYLLYLSALAPALALLYFRAALSLCRWTATHPSLLLHPLDFLGCDDTRDLAFFPAMNLPLGRKLELVGEAVDLLTARFAVLTLEQHAEAAARASQLPVREPRFPVAAATSRAFPGATST